MTNLFHRELKANRKSFIIWTLSTVLLIIFVMAVYPTVSEQSSELQQILMQLPESLLKAFGMDKLEFTNLLGYYGTKAYIFVLLFGGIYAMILGSSLLVKEESDRTAEFLLSKPISRNAIITSKWLSCSLYVVLFNAVTAFAAYLSFEWVKSEAYSIQLFLLLAVGPLLIHWTLGNIGLAVSVWMSNAKSALSISVGTVLGLYFLSVAAELAKALHFLKYVSPFSYVNAPDLILNHKISGVYLILIVLINIVAIGSVYSIYNKKDING